MLKFVEKSGSYTSLICLDEILIIMICNSIHMFQGPVIVASSFIFNLLAVMDNYKNIPQFLYGLSPSQMEMFTTDDNPYNRQSKKVTEVSEIIHRCTYNPSNKWSFSY